MQTNIATIISDSGHKTYCVADLQLRLNDRIKIVDENQCLNDKVVNAAQSLLKRPYPNTQGLQDTVSVAAFGVHLPRVVYLLQFAANSQCSLYGRRQWNV